MAETREEGMVERVARATHEACLRHYGQTRDMSAEPMATHRALARAAIETMQEPTIKMVVAGEDAVSRGSATGYQAMIDAALQEPTNEG